MKKILCLLLTVTILIGIIPVFAAAAVSDIGTVKITTTPAGADVYIDGERYVQKCTPCTIPLPAGEHKLDLVIKGYEECSETVMISKDKETEVEKHILPNIPFGDAAVTVTVTTEEDPYIDESLTVSDLEKLPSISLRQALTAINNDTSSTPYIVDFAENVKHIELTDRNISFNRSNFVINGDRDRDGAPDIVFTKTEWGILFRPMNNLYIIGIRFDDDSSGDSAIGIRPDDYYSGDVSYENIYVLGCEFNNCEIIPFCGACKVYDSYGKVDYTNINACGNVLNNSNMFFAYSGNTDYSTVDGMTYQSNKLDKTSVLSLMCADCNTNYIYGGNNEASNGVSCDRTIFETSDHNIVKNVLICGNDGGRSGAGVAVNGNSYNTIKDVVFRNNRFDDTLNIRPCQPIDERNEGNTLKMIGNTLENVLFEYNIFDYAENNNSTWLGILEFDECSPDTQFILEDNVSRNIIFRKNLFLGHGLYIGDGAYNGAHENNIEPGIDYTVNGGYVIAHAHIVGNVRPNHYTNVNNRFEGITFEENRRVKIYEPYAIWDDSPVHIHIPEYIGWDAAHCVEDGHEQYYTCYCGKYFRDWTCEDEITDIQLWLKTEGCFPAEGHSFGETTVIAPTCNSTGYSVRKCTKCGDNEEFDITEKLNHNYQPAETVTATCDTQGYTNYVCTYCSDAYLGDFVDNTGHHFTNYIFNNDSTCTKDGTMTAKCDGCDKTSTVTAEGSKKGHEPGDPVKKNIITATCTTDGSYNEVYYCTVCGAKAAERTVTISAKGHNKVQKNAVKATCTKDGKEADTVCSLCGKVFTKGNVIPAAGHSYKVYSITKATTTADGKITEKCVCEKTRSTVIPKVSSITLSATKYTYNGNVKSPSVTVKDSKGKALVKGTDYTVTVPTGRKVVGKYTYKINLSGKYYSGTKSLSISIAPMQVTELKSSNEKTTSLKLSWAKVTGAKYYKVEQSADGKTWKTIKTAETNSVTVSSLTAGKKYQYRVTALDSTKKIAGKTSAVLKTGTLTKAPSVTLTAKSKSAGVTWKSVPGASKYVVYKSTDGKKWTKVTTTSKLSYTLTKLTGGKKIYVKLKAVNAYGNPSADSIVKSVTVKK